MSVMVPEKQLFAVCLGDARVCFIPLNYTAPSQSLNRTSTGHDPQEPGGAMALGGDSEDVHKSGHAWRNALSTLFLGSPREAGQ